MRLSQKNKLNKRDNMFITGNSFNSCVTCF